MPPKKKVPAKRVPAKKKAKPVEPNKPELSDEQIEARKLTQRAITNLEKQYGSGIVMRLGSGPLRKEIETIPTGSIGLDRALGVGGIPCGRVAEVYGPEQCLAGESFLQYEVWRGDHRINHKGGTIRRLAERFHQQRTDKEPKQGQHLQINDGVQFYVKSVDDEGRIFRNLVLDVVNTGRKECFQVHTETGQVLRCTLDHKFMTPEGFVPLSDLEIGSEVFVHNNTRVKGCKKYTNRPETYVKYHPHLPTKVVHCEKTDRDYVYYREQTSRLAYEAFLNDMTFDQYIEALNTWNRTQIRTFTFLPDDIHVHHKDEDFTNNSLSNLQLIDPSEHGKLHARDRIRNLSFIATPSKITKIFLVGQMDTYDLRCEYPYNNYIAEGIVVHNSGKTTLALHIVANAQRAGDICAFIDAEHALDIDYAAALGVDIDELLVSQPDCGEQALEIAENFVSSGGVKVVVIDSVAALTPRAEIEGEMGDVHVGLQARLMSQALRKLTATVSRNKAVVIFINQIRMKIGVQWGCFHEDTPVIFADGTQHRIRDVVEQRMEGPVLSFENGKVVPKKIKDWYENSSLSDGEEWITITTSSSGGPSGNMSFTCTPNHIVFKKHKGKWHPTRAGEIREGDLLESWMEQRITYNRIYRDIIFGSLLGNGALNKRSEATACLSLANQEQPEYLAWKLEKLEELGWAPAGNEDRPRWDSQYTAELCVLRNQFYPYGTGFRGIPKHIELTPLMAAVWYMDDGCYKQSHRSGQLSLKRLWPHRRSEVVLARGMLAEFIGCGLDKVTISDAWKGLSIHTSAFAEFSKKIKKYVPECMQYKLNPRDRGAYEDFDSGSLDVSYKIPLPVKVLVAAAASRRKHRAKRKYDLEVEGNYLVGGSYRGVRVHNSPETTSGGNALKFYSSVRLDIRRIGAIKQGTDNDAQFLGNRTRVKVVKNKCSPPFRRAEFDIIYGKGISQAGEILDIGVDEGIIDKSGAWYSFGSERIGQGRERAKVFLEENPDMMNTIKEALN